MVVVDETDAQKRQRQKSEDEISLSDTTGRISQAGFSRDVAAGLRQDSIQMAKQLAVASKRFSALINTDKVSTKKTVH